MGYYTAYQLEIEPSDYELLKEIWRTEHLKNECRYAYALDANGDTENDCKWYEWEEDMRRISKEYPDTLFHLSGEGKGSADIWVATFQDGRMHYRKACIEIEPFDPAELE